MSSLPLSRADERGLTGVLADYLDLCKPRIVLLLVLTAVAAMFPAAQGWPEFSRLIAVCVGGALSSGGAKAINAWFDRDIDAKMVRTRSRPIPDGRVPGWHAIVLGIAMNVVAFVVLWLGANLLAALLALAGALFYVLVYTALLKRSTPHNIVIGGAAGAVPPLVGWAAVTGSLNLTAFSLFLVIFLWTPPHFWALAQMIRGDYRRADVPMLPTVAGPVNAKYQALVYTVLLVGVSLIPFFTGAVSSLYLAAALALGVAFIALAVLDVIRKRWTMRVWVYSMAYLAALFCVLALASFGGATRI